MKNAKRKYLFGLVRLSDKGQIVIPKEAREVFGLKPGDQLLLLGDVKKGMALVKVDECGLVEKISGEVFENERPEESGTDEKSGRRHGRMRNRSGYRGGRADQGVPLARQNRPGGGRTESVCRRGRNSSLCWASTGRAKPPLSRCCPA